MEVTHRVHSEWKNWKRVSVVVVRQEKEPEDQGEDVQESGKTTDIRGRDMSVEEGTGK